MCVCVVVQSHPTLCDPMDCSPPGSSVHGILQARILEWVAIPSFRGSSLSNPEMEFGLLQADSLPFELLGKPLPLILFNFLNFCVKGNFRHRQAEAIV